MSPQSLTSAGLCLDCSTTEYYSGALSYSVHSMLPSSLYIVKKLIVCSCSFVYNKILNVEFVVFD